MRVRKNLAFLSVFLLFLVVGCAKKSDKSNIKIRFAQQYGMQYAPVYVMKELGLLEELLPDANLEWNRFGGGSAMNEALISNQLDVGFMGIPPVLIAIDRGVEYKIACGISVPPAELIIHPNSGINNLKDIKSEDKIAVPGIGSVQHIMLSIAAKKILGDAKVFDKNLITMANPDAYAALTSGTDVVGHFASMPYIDLEINDGMKSILTADEIGGGSSIVCVTTKDFSENKEVHYALMKALNQSIELINNGDEKAIKIIADTEKISVEAAKKYISWPGTKYTKDLYRLDELAEFMSDAGFLKNEYEGFESVTWEGAKEGK